jgi:hypothetical protein
MAHIITYPCQTNKKHINLDKYTLALQIEQIIVTKAYLEMENNMVELHLAIKYNNTK